MQEQLDFKYGSAAQEYLQDDERELENILSNKPVFQQINYEVTRHLLRKIQTRYFEHVSVNALVTGPFAQERSFMYQKAMHNQVYKLHYPSEKFDLS